MSYITGNFSNWESRFHQYSLNHVDGTGAGSIWSSYITEANHYSGITNSAYYDALFVKWNREYQHELFNYTRNPSFWTANLFLPSTGTGVLIYSTDFTKTRNTFYIGATI